VYGTTVYFFKNSCTNWIAKADECQRAEACVAAIIWTNNTVNFLLSVLDLLEQKQFINLCVDEDIIQELLEAVPQELTNEELLELEQECITEEEETEKETAEEKEPLRKFTLKFSKSFCRPQQVP